MNGVKYYRTKKGLNQKQLAALSGVSMVTIAAMEKGGRNKGIYPGKYIKIKAVLCVSVDELLREDFPAVEDGAPVRILRRSRTENVQSCLTQYRHVHRLTLDEMSSRLGVTSKECSRQACAAEVSLEKHIQTLASFEGLSVIEFIELYTPSEEDLA